MRNLQPSDDWYDDDDWFGNGESYNTIKVLVPKISASLSLIGSLTVIAEIIMDHKAKKGTTISRVLFNLSLGDVFSSFAFFLSSWPAPKYSQHIGVWNIGNEATCSAQGFILQMGLIATPLFNLILTWCYYSVIAKGTTERQLQYYEKCFYTVVWGLTLAFSVALIPLEMYNAEFFVCAVAPYPYTCTESWMSDDEYPANCIRGDNSFMALLTMTAILWVVIVCVVVLLIKTIRSVEETEKKSLLWGYQSLSRRSPLTQPQSRGTNGGVVRSNNVNLWRTQLMRQHSYRYIAVFLLTYLSLTAYVIAYWFIYNQFVSAVMAILVTVTLPLQGFWNFLIFSGNRNMSTVVGRILKKRTHRIFQSCCCWGKSSPAQRESQRTTGRIDRGLDSPNQGDGTSTNGETNANASSKADNHQDTKHAVGETRDSNEDSMSRDGMQQVKDQHDDGYEP